ncbi:MAG TPA: hypothetical protein DCL41_05045 [Bdellovibrionales bacterium]|nr:hypothetical protein [Pseudobdellovibrionaceae bacterium]HAG91213.1 hypothetical protein [Bdellovibrionales bacterium]
MSSWLILFFAGILEIFWAVGLKYTEGFTRIIPSALTLIALAGSMYLLSKAAQTLPIGTAYAIWVGIGAVGASIFGILLFKEPLTAPRMLFMALLIISIVGLKFTASQ